MRRRWRTIESLWEQNKSENTTLSLLDQIDYFGKLQSQLPAPKACLLYSKSGQPTAAALVNSSAIVDSSLYRIACSGLAEACFLAAIVNSRVLADTVRPYMSKGQFGARDLAKHLWRLPVPEYDTDVPLHRELAAAGHQASYQAVAKLRRVERERAAAGKVTPNSAARKALRAWLDSSAIGLRIETLVKQLGLW